MSATTTRPPPIFVISFNRPGYLRSAVDAYRRLSPESDLVIHDFGSDDQETLGLLADLEREITSVVRDAKAEQPADLNRVDATVKSYFETRPAARYVVTDCDIDMSVTETDALDVYGELLDRLAPIACAGPMLRIRDIPATHPLYARVMNTQITLFWNREPLWTHARGRKVAYLEAKIDTTFALHRAGDPFRRLKPAARVYFPYEARHLDWYLPHDPRSGYATSASGAISHWGHAGNVERARSQRLGFREFLYVDCDERGELCTRVMDLRRSAE